MICCKPIVRSRWFPNESWPGYLQRLAEDNRYEGIRGLARLLEVFARDLVLAEPRDVLAVLGLSESSPINSPQALKQRKHQRATKTHSVITGVCPCCLATDKKPYIRADWELPLQVDCAVHHVELVRACPSCHRGLSIYRSRLHLCDCGYDLRRAPATPLARQVAPEVINRAFGLRRREQMFPRRHARETSALRVLQRIAHFEKHGADAKLVKQPRHSPPYLTVEELRRIEPWFADWPTSLKTHYIRASWGEETLGPRYISEAALGVADFPSIARVVKPLTRDALEVRRGCEFVNLDAAAALAGHTPQKISNWIKAGLLGQVKIVRKVFRIPVAKLLAVVQQLDGSVGASEAARRLAIFPRGLYRLLEKKVIPALGGYSNATSNIKTSDLDEFMSVIISHLQVASAPAGDTQPLSEILSSLHDPTPAKVFAAISEDRLAIFSPVANPSSLAGIYVLAKDYNRFKASHRRRPVCGPPLGPQRVLHGNFHIARKGDEWVTLHAAAEIAGVTRQELKKWAASGALGEQQLSKRRPCVQLSKLLDAVRVAHQVRPALGVAREIKMPLRVALALSREGLVGTSRIQTETCFIATEDLLDLMQRLLRCSKSCTDAVKPRAMRPLHAVLGAPFDGAVTDALLAIGSGRLNLFIPASSPRDLSLAWVPEAAYQEIVGARYRGKTRAPRSDRPGRGIRKHEGANHPRLIHVDQHLALRGDEYISWKAAAQAAGTTEFLLSRWVAAGVLEGRRSFGLFVAVPVRSLWTAMDRMAGTLSATEAAQRLGLRRRALYRLVADGGMLPACVGPARSMFFRIEDVDSFAAALMSLSTPRSDPPQRVRPLTTVLESQKAKVQSKSIQAIRDGRLRVFHPPHKAATFANAYVDHSEYWTLMVGKNHASTLSRKASKATR